MSLSGRGRRGHDCWRPRDVDRWRQVSPLSRSLTSLTARRGWRRRTRPPSVSRSPRRAAWPLCDSCGNSFDPATVTADGRMAVTCRPLTALVLSRTIEYLAVYGRASIGVPVGELQSAMAPTTDYCLSHLRRLGLRHIFCHGQKRDYTWVSRASQPQRARGATKKLTKHLKSHMFETTSTSLWRANFQISPTRCEK